MTQGEIAETEQPTHISFSDILLLLFQVTFTIHFGSLCANDALTINPLTAGAAYIQVFIFY